MDQKILNQEQTHLKETIEKVANAKIRLDQSMLVMGQENLEFLKELRQNPETNGADFFFFLEGLHEKNATFNFKEKYKMLEEFESAMNEPYFARIDLENTKENITESFYIGKFGYTENAPVITDWRAKIASVYYRYRYPQKNVMYDTPEGPETRNLTLKRTYEIDKGNLVKFFNNDIQLDENEIITDKISKRTGGVLEDIIETIQESQLNIIEADPRQVCIVQGCVGSGKSTVAIHKLSHIFFNYANLIHPERSILIAKNQILVGYLSTLFPKLGIFDINYKSLRDLIYISVFREELKLNVDFDLNSDAFSFGIDKIRAVLKDIDDLHESFAKEIEAIFNSGDFESFKSYKYNKTYTIARNVSDIIEDLDEELEMEKEFIKENPDSIKTLMFRENIRALKKLTHSLKQLRVRVKETTMKDLSKKYKINPNTKMGYLETLIYLFIYSEVVGLEKMVKFEYCVVDEGQDFSVLEYLVLSKLVLNGRFCILGDLNQSYEMDGITTWSDIAEVIREAKKANTFELNTNYRSTKPIIDLANQILKPYTETYLPKSINRRGPDPITTTANDTDELLKLFTAELSSEIKKLDKSIGIICFNDDLYAKVDEILSKFKSSKDVIIRLDKKQKISYIPKGIYLSKFEDCKGLEFAKVYVLDLNLDKITNFKQAKKAFVAVTRAMNEVSIYSLK